MRMRYDREGDVLDVLVKEAQIHHAEEHGQIIVNYDEEGKVVEIEILDASKVLGGFLAEIIKSPKREIVEIL
jgi:YD repeat-containing protein